jgi:hypothetical protein
MFKSEEHKTRFLEAMQSIGKIYDGKLDQEYGAALYLLTSHPSVWNKTRPYVFGDGIDFELILEEVVLSGGEWVVIKWAGNLFGQDQHIDPTELMRLDRDNFEAAINALRLRRDPMRLEELETPHATNREFLLKESNSGRV